MNLLSDDERDTPEEGPSLSNQQWERVVAGYHQGEAECSTLGNYYGKFHFKESENLIEPNDYPLENIFKQCQ